MLAFHSKVFSARLEGTTPRAIDAGWYKILGSFDSYVLQVVADDVAGGNPPKLDVLMSWSNDGATWSTATTVMAESLTAGSLNTPIATVASSTTHGAYVRFELKMEGASDVADVDLIVAARRRFNLNWVSPPVAKPVGAGGSGGCGCKKGGSGVGPPPGAERIPLHETGRPHHIWQDLGLGLFLQFDPRGTICERTRAVTVAVPGDIVRCIYGLLHGSVTDNPCSADFYTLGRGGSGCPGLDCSEIKYGVMRCAQYAVAPVAAMRCRFPGSPEPGNLVGWAQIVGAVIGQEVNAMCRCLSAFPGASCPDCDPWTGNGRLHPFTFPLEDTLQVTYTECAGVNLALDLQLEQSLLPPGFP